MSSFAFECRSCCFWLQEWIAKQPSFDKALRQQDGLKDSKSSFDLFESFRNQEVDYVAELLQEYSIDRELVGTNNIKNHHEYKELKEELEELDEQIEEKESTFSDLETEVEELSSAKVSYQRKCKSW